MTEPHVDVEALHKALDTSRRAKGLTWRELARQVNVSPSTLTRMAQGLRPDVDSFAALVTWLGMSADGFIRGSHEAAKHRAEPVAAVMTYLRAEKELSPGAANALETILRAAYDQLKDK